MLWKNSTASTNLVLLIPASGDLSVYSDAEEIPEDLLDEDYVMEPTSEMELEEGDEDSTGDVADGEAEDVDALNRMLPLMKQPPAFSRKLSGC